MKLVYKIALVASVNVLTVDCSYRFNENKETISPNTSCGENKCITTKNVNNNATGDMRQYSNDHIQLQLN